MIFTVDIATCTGWAFGPPGANPPLFGERQIAFAPASEEIIFDRFDAWFSGQLDTLRPRHIYAEDVFMPRSLMVARRLFGLRALAIAAARRRDLRINFVPVQTIQRFHTGVGRWPRGEKKAATIRMCQHYGWFPQTDNQADALAIWLFAEHAIAPHVRRTAGSLFVGA